MSVMFYQEKETNELKCQGLMSLGKRGHGLLILQSYLQVIGTVHNDLCCLSHKQAINIFNNICHIIINCY